MRALPLSAVVEIGNRKCCYLFEDGKAVQTYLQTGINDGKWVEVSRKQIKGTWVEFTEADEVILSNLAELSNGQPVKVVDKPAAAGSVKK